MNIHNRPRGMSQLDWLITTFGEYEIAKSLYDEKAIVTTDLVKDLVLEGSGIIKLTAVDLENDQILLTGYDSKNNKITTATLNKNSEVVAFEPYTLTLIEEDKGIGNKGDVYYRLSLSNGQYLYAPAYSGADSNTIITEVLENKISSSLRIANPILDKSVKLTATDKGVRADLIIDSNVNSNIELSIDKGVSARLKWLDSEDLVGFKEINYDEYNLINPRKGVVYFCPDEHKLILNGTVYPLSISIDIDDIYKKIDAVNLRVEDLIGLAPEDLDSLEEVAEAIKNGDNRYLKKGDYAEYIPYIEGRKTIQLRNYDSISGVKTTGEGVNIAMVSKWDVADFGSTQLPINLNGSNSRPTYNDNKEIALLEDILDLDTSKLEDRLDDIEQNLTWNEFD